MSESVYFSYMVLISCRIPFSNLLCYLLFASNFLIRKMEITILYFIELLWVLNDVIGVKCLEQHLEHYNHLIDINGDGGGDIVHHITLYAPFIGTYR